jgi:hypothetical protein
MAHRKTKRRAAKGRTIRAPKLGDKVNKPTYPTRPELKFIKRAAELKGVSDSGFMVDESIRGAKRVVPRDEWPSFGL